MFYHRPAICLSFIISLALGASWAGATSYDSALVHYQFDQTQLNAGVFQDLTSNDVDLVVSGSGTPTIVSSLAGDAVVLPSTAQLVPQTAGSDSILNLTSSLNSKLSLSMWAQRPDNDDDFIISKMESSGNFRGWWVIIENTGQIGVIFRYTNTSTGPDRLWYRTTDEVIPDADNDFHHIAFTYDFVDSGTDPNRGIKVYVDGVAKDLTIDVNTSGTNFDSNDFDLSNSNPFTINGRNGVGTLGSNGTLAELAIWNSALTASQIDYQYQSVVNHAGDANGDGMVNLADLQILGDNWQATDAGWSAADFSGDQAVNLADLQIIGDNWGYGAGADVSFDEALAQVGIVVPEPATLGLLGLALPLILRRRTNR